MNHLNKLAFYCYFQALAIAVRDVFSGNVKSGLKLLVASVGYWRFHPNAIVLDLARKLQPTRILDVSSPKLISLILSADFPVHAIDLDDPQLETRWAKTARALGRDKFTYAYGNACQLVDASETYDFVYSLSVIEHIPGTGDTEAMREIARVLRPGGQALIEVPLRHHYAEHFHRYDSKGFALPEPRFYERHYCPKTIDRLLVPELKLSRQWAMGEDLPVDPWIATPRLPRLLRLIVLPFEPFLAAANIWLEPNTGRDRPLSMILLFEKPLSGN